MPPRPHFILSPACVLKGCLPGAVGLLLAGCEARQPAQRPAGAAALPTPWTMPAALRRQPLPDSLGPRPLRWQDVDLTGLTDQPNDGLQVDTLPGGCLQAREAGQAPRLFYRPTAHSARWREIDLALPELNGGDWANGNATLALDTANLNQQGRPELLVTAETWSVGSGSGQRQVYQVALDVSSRPLLLLRGVTEVASEVHGDGSEAVPADERETTCQQPIRLRGHELVVGSLTRQGRPAAADCAELTRLPAGRYRYQGGRVQRVGPAPPTR